MQGKKNSNFNLLSTRTHILVKKKKKNQIKIEFNSNILVKFKNGILTKTAIIYISV